MACNRSKFVRRPSAEMASGSAIALTLGICAASAQSLLLVPDSLPNSSGAKVWAFSAVDGSVVNPNFIAPDAYLSQPIEIVVSPAGTLLITDETANAIFEYSVSGGYIRTIVGPTQGIDRPYGMEVVGEWIYFSMSITQGSVTTGVLKRVRLDGTGLEDWCVLPQVVSPRDIVHIGSGDFLVGDSGLHPGGEDIERIGPNCSISAGPWHDSDGISGIDFPQQITLPGDGTVLAAGFSDPYGLFTYDLQLGLEIARVSDLLLSPRGVHRMHDGRYFYTGGTRVTIWDPIANTNIVIVNQVSPTASVASFRWVTPITIAPSCPTDLDGDGTTGGSDLTVLLGSWGSVGGDVNGDGTTNGSDLSVLLGAWGVPCD
jgi:hypothetical protein